MAVKHFIALLFLYIIQCYALTPIQEPIVQQSKKKLVLLISKGGHGHLSAARAMEKLLSPTYQITILNPFQDMLDDLDVVKKISFHRMDCEDFYNALLSANLYTFTNFFATNLGPFLGKRNSAVIQKRMTTFLQKEHADMLISLIPIINFPCAQAAAACAIPFLIVTLDGNLQNWVNQLELITHPCWGITVGYDSKTTTGLIQQKRLDAHNIIHYTGFPIRTEFTEQANKIEIKKYWHVPQDKPVVMIMTGGCGSTRTCAIVREIKKIKQPIHLLVCIGRNTRLEKKLRAIKNNPDVSLSIIPFTHKIADLMSISDLIITKSGPGSILEAIHKDLPMLLDQTRGCLAWEEDLGAWIEKIGAGKRIKRIGNIKKLVQQYLQPEIQKETRAILTKIPKNTFAQAIHPLVTQLLTCNAQLNNKTV